MEDTKISIVLDPDDDYVRVIFEHLGDEFNYTRNIVMKLVSSLKFAHQEQNCSYFRKVLQVLNFALTLQNTFSTKSLKSDEDCAIYESICDICIHTLRSMVNSKDICMPVLCDVLSHSLTLIDSVPARKKVKIILKECSEEISFLMETTCITSEDQNGLLPELVKLGINLRIIEAVIVSLSNQRSQANTHEAMTSSDCSSLFDHELLNLLVKLTSCGNEVLTAQVLLCVIPKLINITCNPSFLHKVWNQITVMFQSEQSSCKSSSYIFPILCMLADFFVPCNVENSVCYFSIVKEKTFWEILQHGLPSQDPLVRKQALYLLKRGIDHGTNVDLSYSTKDSLFWWHPEKHTSFRKTWNELFLLLEVLEEKQIHLIKPVEPALYSLIEGCKQSILHYSWILCVIQRALTHECNSVMKWGVTCLISLDLTLYLVPGENYLFLPSLMTALNNSSLYVKNKFSISCPEIVEGLKSYFAAVTQCPQEVCQQFFSTLLQSLLMVSWGPVALFYVIYSLSAVPKTPVWKTSDINQIKNFLIDTLSTQIVHIRGAIQSFSMSMLIQLSDEIHLDVWIVADILGTFKRKESLRRGTRMWADIVIWLKTWLTSEEAIEFCHRSVEALSNGGKLKCDKQSIARMIILLSDAGLLSLDDKELSSKYSLSSALCRVTKYFENCHTRLYVGDVKQDDGFELILLLLEESRPQVSENDLTAKKIMLLVENILPGLIFCINKKMFSACDLHSYRCITVYIHSLDVLWNEFILLPFMLKEAEILQDLSLSIIKTNSDNTHTMIKYCSIKILLWISNFIETCEKRPDCYFDIKNSMLYQRHFEFVLSMCVSRNLNKLLTRGEGDENVTRDLQSRWGRIVSEHLHAKWSILNAAFDLLVSTPSSFWSYSQIIFRNAVEALEMGGRGVLVPVMSVMQRILPEFIRVYFQEVERFISVCWTEVFELRKSDLFWVSMKKFIAMIFQADTMKDEKMQDILLSYAHRILVQGEAIRGLSNLLMEQLKTITENGNLWVLDPFVGVLADAVLFGTVHRRDQKIDYETSLFIQSLGDKCSGNNTFVSSESDTEVRALGVHIILILQNSTSHGGILTKLAKKLIEKDRQASLQKTRYFADSYHHRFKHRIMQALLVLESSLPEEECKNLMSYLQNSLLSENHQPSIRYFQEWLLMRLIVKNEVHDLVWTMLTTASEKRPGSLCSFISIIYHIACVLPSGYVMEQFVDRAIGEILPWSMAQHFSIRLYAQVVVYKLWEFALEKNLSDVVEKYTVMYTCVKSSLSTSGALKNAQKLLEDFYFTSFHPFRHYSLKTIFWDLPRLANVTPEEWISEELFQSVGLFSSSIPLCNEDSSLENANCHFTAKSSSGGCDDDAIRKDFSNMQKKIIPWKAMIPDPDLLLSLSESVLKRKQNLEDGLIVVATLIDRPPNLGGLSRTCEAFGVSQYVVANLKVLEDKQFQTLSVTAERWLSVVEVKPYEIPQYLMTMKNKGYTVVGAEQTASSIQLHEMSFPKRTILLLGNEKEGIPVDLLPSLDVCVEIPQQGVVRSLNVHVTGAIFIWEYARQHVIK